MTRQIFEKTYTRDTTLIIQEAWHSTLKNTFEELGISAMYPDRVVHYLNHGTIEIWENTTATQALLDKLLEKNQNDESYYFSKMEEYLPKLKLCEEAWKKGYTSSVSELVGHIDLVFDAMKT